MPFSKYIDRRETYFQGTALFVSIFKKNITSCDFTENSINLISDQSTVWKFFCHSDFTWNHGWQIMYQSQNKPFFTIERLWILNLEFYEFLHFWKAEIYPHTFWQKFCVRNVILKKLLNGCFHEIFFSKTLS